MSIRVNPRALAAAAARCYGRGFWRGWADLSEVDQKIVLAWLDDFLREYDAERELDLARRRAGERALVASATPSPSHPAGAAGFEPERIV